MNTVVKFFAVAASLLLGVNTMNAKSEVGRTTVGDIVYTLHSDGTASVSGVRSRKISGKVEIAGTITENDVTYYVKSIDSAAFRGCGLIESVDMPYSLKSIESYAFEGCNSLKSVYIPEEVVFVREASFKDCGSLEEVVFGGPFVRVEVLAFRGCKSLKRVVFKGPFADVNSMSFIPEMNDLRQPELVVVTSDSFKRYLNLLAEFRWENIVVDPSVAVKHSFYHKEVFSDFDSKSLSWYGDYRPESEKIETGRTTVDGLVYTLHSNGTASVATGQSRGISGKVIIPESITAGGESYGVSAIDSSAFYACSLIESVYVPDRVSYIGCEAFAGCISLKSIHLPHTTRTIEPMTFFGCRSLENVIIPNYVEFICSGAFGGCTSLKYIRVPDLFWCVIGSLAFVGCESLEKVDFCGFGTQVCTYAFKDCGSLGEVRFQTAFTDVCSMAFEGCGSLRKVTVVSDAFRDWLAAVDEAVPSPVEYVVDPDVDSTGTHIYYNDY